MMVEKELSPSDVSLIVADVASALEHLHSQGYYHRDLKPDNIVIDETGRAVVVDLGFCLHQEEQWDQEGKARGTREYMSADMLVGMTHLTDRRSDIYAIGAVLFELLTGAPPGAGDSKEESFVNALMVSLRPPTFPPNVPEGIQKICLRCLASASEARFETAADVERAIRAALASDGEASAKAEGPLVAPFWRLGVRWGRAATAQRSFEEAVHRDLPALLSAADQSGSHSRVGLLLMIGVSALEEASGCIELLKRENILIEEPPECRSLWSMIRGRFTKAQIEALPTTASVMRSWLKEMRNRAEGLLEERPKRSRHAFEAGTYASEYPNGGLARLLQTTDAAGIERELIEEFAREAEASGSPEGVRLALEQLERRVDRQLFPHGTGMSVAHRKGSCEAEIGRE